MNVRSLDKREKANRLKIPISVPVNGKSAIFTPLYLVNTFGRNKKVLGFGLGAGSELGAVLGFGLGAAPRAQIRGLFVSTKGVIEIISIWVEIARRSCVHLLGFGVDRKHS